MNQWISAANVRTYANLDGTAGRYSDAAIGSNIRAAQTMIEQRTGRTFESSSGTRYFTTENRAAIAIPDLRGVTAVTLNGTALTANETYWLLPDPRWSSIYSAIQFRPFGRSRERWYLSVPDWFDRGLDSSLTYGTSSLPNDLAVSSTTWGWDPVPDDVLHAVKVLAAWITKRSDALLGNAVQTPDGTVLDYSQMPPEVAAVISTYRAGEQAVAFL